MYIALFIMIPFALVGAFVLGVFCKDEWERKFRQIPIYNPYPYDPNSPMVQRFQYLAGIRGGLYVGTSESLRNRFNRVRSTCSNYV